MIKYVPVYDDNMVLQKNPIPLGHDRIINIGIGY